MARLIEKNKMSNFERTANWLAACGKQPSAHNLSLQIGCDIEEGVEFLEILDLDGHADAFLLRNAIYNLKTIATRLKAGQSHACISDENREKALDAICDREVTGNGVAHFAGFNKPAADLAVLASNDAKLVDGKPVILPGGKIGKPEGWTAPNLKGFV